jgi:hemerythrin superfamily protein
MSMTEPNAVGVVATIQRDHRQIEAMIDDVERSTGGVKQDAFEELVRKLAVHETAEEMVVHPLMKDAGAGDVADQVLREEDHAKKVLAEVDGMDVTSPEFDAKFREIKREVLAHAEHEEREEHPALMRNESREHLERLATVFEAAERTAPTRPHTAAPESRLGNLALGPILAVTDRVRDAIRNATKR